MSNRNRSVWMAASPKKGIVTNNGVLTFLTRTLIDMQETNLPENMLVYIYIYIYTNTVNFI